MNIHSANPSVAAHLATRAGSVDPRVPAAEIASSELSESKGGLFRDRVELSRGEGGGRAAGAELSPADRIAAIQAHMAERVADLRGSLGLDEGQRSELTAALRELDSSLNRIMNSYESGTSAEGLGDRLQDALGVFRKQVGDAVAPPAGNPPGDSGGEGPDALSASERVEAIAKRFAERLGGLADSAGLDEQGRSALLESGADFRRTLARIAGILDDGGALTKTLRSGLREAMRDLRSDVASIFGGGPGTHATRGRADTGASILASRMGIDRTT
jgi:hypothetical protein